MEIYLSEAEFAARYLKGARRTAQRWRVTGEGPKFVRLGPRRIAYREKDCEEWAEGSHVPQSRGRTRTADCIRTPPTARATADREPHVDTAETTTPYP